MKIISYIYDNITDLHKVKTELPALLGAAYMTIMTYFDFDIFTESVRPILIPFCMAIGWVLSTALVFAKLRLLYIDFKIKKLDQKSKELKLQNDIKSHEAEVRGHKILEEFYNKVNQLPENNKEEMEDKIKEITDATNSHHSDYIKAINNG